MQVTLEIPDTFAAELIAAGKDPARSALEALLLEGYRKHLIFEGEIKQTLGYRTRMQVHEFLKDNGVPLNYDVPDYEQDLQTLRKLRTSETSAAA